MGDGFQMYASSTSATESFPFYSLSSLSLSLSFILYSSIYLLASIPPHPRTPLRGLSAIMTAEELHIRGNIGRGLEGGGFCSLAECRVAKTRLILEQTCSGTRIKLEIRRLRGDLSDWLLLNFLFVVFRNERKWSVIPIHIAWNINVKMWH